MNIDIEKKITHYTKERIKGLGFSSIRKELTNQGLSDKKIRDIIDLLGQREIREAQRKRNNSKNINIALMGLFLFVLGSAITVNSYMNGKEQYVLWYGAILVGIGMFASGLLKYRKK